MGAVTVEELGYDPDANDETRDLLRCWVECFARSVQTGRELVEWVQALSLRDPRLTRLAATSPEQTMGDYGEWTTTDAQHEAIEAWQGGDDAAREAWLDSFVAEAERSAREP